MDKNRMIDDKKTSCFVFEKPDVPMPEINRQYGLWLFRGGSSLVSPEDSYQRSTVRIFEFYSISHLFRGHGKLWLENGFETEMRTGDCVIIADCTLHIVDYKHGRGVLVEADDNPQMKLYALGALELFDCIYDIDIVSMSIYQPRRSNVSTFTIPKEELYEWADQVLAPTAELAFNGDGEYHCGEWCQFCKAKADCRERANANMELAKFEFRQPPLLTDEEVEEILGRIDELIAWASDIKDYGLQAAISGKQWSGYKLVEGRSNRKYTDENAVIAAVTAAGYDPYEHKILGVTAMTSLLGKKQFNGILGDLITKPQGKPTLVPDSDKRPAMTTIIDDFKENN